MKRVLVVIFFLIIGFTASFAQRRLNLQSFTSRSEIGFFGGGSYYLGDLNRFKQFYHTRPAFGVVYRKNFNPRYAFKLNGFYGSVEAFDSDSRNKFQKARNLGFRSKIYEISGQIEFNYLPFTIGDPETPYSPYLFIGLSVFNFNPSAILKGSWVDLKDYSTEGQGLVAGRKNYSTIQVSVPFGGGVKFNLSENMGLALEWGLRKTYTDYIDDVSTTYISADINKLNGPDAVALADPSEQSSQISVDKTGVQRGNSSRNDFYSFAGIILTWRFGKDNKCYFNKF